MEPTITIPFRFRGPPNSGNGGVSAGLLAARGTGTMSVRLRRPPPLDAPLTVREEGEKLTALAGDEVVLIAQPGDLDIDPPLDDDSLQRAMDRGTTPVPAGWAAPECFVCGPRRDGLRICPHHLPGTEVWATVWVPDESVSSDGATVDEFVVWGALDCPAGIAVTRAGLAPLEFFPALTELTVDIRRPPAVGEPVIVVGWMVGDNEERVDGATAVVGSDGAILAVGYARHARVPLDFAARNSG